VITVAGGNDNQNRKNRIFMAVELQKHILVAHRLKKYNISPRIKQVYRNVTKYKSAMMTDDNLISFCYFYIITEKLQCGMPTRGV
jgi:hypothetical protein